MSSQRELQDGWVETTTADGKVYYYHRETRVTSWVLPGQAEAATATAVAPTTKTVPLTETPSDIVTSDEAQVTAPK